MGHAIAEFAGKTNFCKSHVARRKEYFFVFLLHVALPREQLTCEGKVTSQSVPYIPLSHIRVEITCYVLINHKVSESVRNLSSGIRHHL